MCGETHINRHGKEYTYYKCNRYYGYGKCKEKYIREEKLIEEVANLVGQVDEGSFQMRKNIQQEVERINEMEELRYGDKAKLMTVQEYLCFILKNGKTSEKSDVIRCLRDQLVLKDGMVSLQLPSLIQKPILV